MRKRKPQKTARIEFEWDCQVPKRLNASRCWNRHFWYGDGKSATEASVIVRLRDYRRMLREARKDRELLAAIREDCRAVDNFIATRIDIVLRIDNRIGVKGVRHG